MTVMQITAASDEAAFDMNPSFDVSNSSSSQDDCLSLRSPVR